MQEIEGFHQIEDIDQLVEEISAYLQKAIIIENDDFELIAYSSPSGYAFDPVQQKTILAKRCPLYVIERLKKEGIIEKLARSNEPLRMNRMADIDFFERIVISLKMNGRILGYLWIYETEQLTEDALSFLTVIAPHLAKVLHKQWHQEADQKQSLIWQLMNDEHLNEPEILQAAKKVSYTIPKAFTVIVYSVQDARFVRVLEKIKDLLVKNGFSYYLGKGTEVIGIIDGNNPETSRIRAEAFMKKVEECMLKEETVSLFVGAGNVYNKVRLIRQSYLEALEVIETMIFLDSSKQIIVHFKELGMYRYVKVMYKKNVSEQYRNIKLLTLMHHDMENKSELLKTLWYFLRYDSKVARTAEALFIHPNTLSYRLKQMNQITTFNLSDMEEKMELYSQLILIHLVADYRKFYMDGLRSLINLDEED